MLYSKTKIFVVPLFSLIGISLLSGLQYRYQDEYVDVSVGGVETEVKNVEFDAYLDRVKISASLDLLKTVLKGTEFKVEEKSDLLTFLMDLYSVEISGGELSVEGEDPTEFVEFKMDEVSVEFSDMNMVTSMRDDFPDLSSLKGELTVRGIELNISPRLSYEFYDITRQFGGTPGILAIDRFNAEVSYNRRGRVTLSGNLSTPYGKASVGGELLFDERYPERSTIRKFNLTVQNLSEELQEVLEEWELETGNSLPRKGRNIEINITGTLGEPLMDGKPLIESSYYYEDDELYDEREKQPAPPRILVADDSDFEKYISERIEYEYVCDCINNALLAESDERSFDEGFFMECDDYFEGLSYEGKDEWNAIVRDCLENN